MCAGAIVQARIPTVIYGTADPKAGACHSLFSITEDDRLNHRCTLCWGAFFVRTADGSCRTSLANSEH